jgi:hypothetical protein
VAEDGLADGEAEEDDDDVEEEEEEDDGLPASRLESVGKGGLGPSFAATSLSLAGSCLRPQGAGPTALG